MMLCRVLICVAAVRLLSGADAPLTQIRNVYLLPMAGGLDQHLANKLTRTGRFNVVTDVKQAEVIFTDQIGEAFEGRYLELFPPPPRVQSEAERKAANEDNRMGSLLGEASSVRRTSTFNRSRGNVFLVEVASARVLWSTYLPPRGKRSEDLSRAADTIVDRLEDDRRNQAKRMQRDQEAAAKAARPSK
jgi:hypothetical protein